MARHLELVPPLQLTLGPRICRRCSHREDEHPNSFLCQIEDCRCPGFFLDRSKTLIPKETHR